MTFTSLYSLSFFYLLTLALLKLIKNMLLMFTTVMKICNTKLLLRALCIFVNFCTYLILHSSCFCGRLKINSNSFEYPL